MDLRAAGWTGGALGVDRMVRSSRVARQHQNPNVAQQWRGDDCRPTGTVKVTAALPLRANAGTQKVSIGDMNMEPTNSMLVRVSRFLGDRYAYRTQPDYLSELVVFGTVVFIALWPVILVAHAMAGAPR